jgi:hypothetical protein
MTWNPSGDTKLSGNFIMYIINVKQGAIHN